MAIPGIYFQKEQKLLPVRLQMMEASLYKKGVGMDNRVVGFIVVSL